MVNSTSAWPGDRTVLPVRLGAKSGELVGILLHEEAGCERSPGTVPTSSTQLFVWLLSPGWIQIPPQAWTPLARMCWFEPFPHHKVGTGPLGSRARGLWRKSCSVMVLSPSTFLFRFASRISGFGRSRLKFGTGRFLKTPYS